MSIDSRLRNFEKSLNGRELALLWLKSSQVRGGFLEYWKSSEFHPWVSESEEAGLLYHLVFRVNSAVLMAAQRWREIGAYASPLVISMIAESIDLALLEAAVGGFVELWRQKLCRLLREVVTLQQAVELISKGYFDGHQVLFFDVQEQIKSSWENTELLVLGYNLFASENGKATIDIAGIEHGPLQGVEQLLNEWVMLSRSHALAAGGKIFQARDEVLRFLNMTNTSRSTETPKGGM